MRTLLMQELSMRVMSMRIMSLRTLIVVLSMLFTIPLSSTVRAEGTETLGPATLPLAPGSGIVAAGVGLETQPGTLNIDVPGTVQQTILYWSGGATGAGNAGDPTIVINGNSVTGVLIGGPTLFYDDVYFSAYRADITSLNLVSEGANALTIEGKNFDTENNGAGLLVIYDDGTTLNEIELRDGMDTAFVNAPGARQSTVAQTFTFAPDTVERVADLEFFFGSVSPGTFRPTSIEVTVGGETTLYSNLLSSSDGPAWDTLSLDVVIPPGATSLTVQAFSRDDFGDSQTPRAASFTWSTSALAVPEPQQPGIALKKYTNGEDADDPTGPLVPVGSTVTWTYVVSNTGNVPLTAIEVTDNIPGVTPVYVSGDTNANDALDLTESWLFQATGIAVAGQYANIGTVTGTPPAGPNVTDEDPSHYFGVLPGIAIKKYTNGEDADTPTGPVLLVGSTVTWTYQVSNTGNVPLSAVNVTDNIAGVIPTYISGDTNGNTLLDLDELWLFRATGTAVAGQYANIGTVTGTPPTGPAVTDEDPSHYFGALPGIAIKKYTNGEDADTPTGPTLTEGDTVTWTYIVSNTGNVPLTAVTVTDNIPGVTPTYVSGDTNSDNVLDLDEVWLFRAEGTAIVGQYANIGTARGTPPLGPDVTDEDPSHYFGDEDVPPTNLPEQEQPLQEQTLF